MYSPVNYLIFSFLFFISSESARLLQGESSHNWGYEDDNGPHHWGGVCQSGSNQSPINIKLETVKIKRYPSFKFNESYYKKHPMSFVNNGHTIQVTVMDNFRKPSVLGGGLNGRFVFEQLHFHWESEHEFEGKRADLEMHLVHYNEKYSSFSGAAAHPDGVAVFAVLFDVSEDTEHGVEDFFDYLMHSVAQTSYPEFEIPDAGNSIDHRSHSETKSYSLRDLLPKDTSRFFRYYGSLTTPGCDEVVQWTIFANRFPISDRVMDFLRNTPDHHGSLLSQNYRPPQPLNGRNVYLQILDSDSNEEEKEEKSNGAWSKNAKHFYIIALCSFAYFYM